MSNVKYLIDVSNKAKKIRDFDLANSVFAVLLELRNEDGVRRFVETEDIEGEHSSQSAYDLLTIEFENESACIPVPLVDYSTAFVFAKSAVVVEKEDHNRKYSEVSEAERAAISAELRAEFAETFGANRIATFIRCNLAENVSRDVVVIDENGVHSFRNQIVPFAERLVMIWQPEVMAEATNSGADLEEYLGESNVLRLTQGC